MPTVNVFYDTNTPTFDEFTSKIKDFLIPALSNKEIILSEKEISVRYIHCNGEAMIASVEVEITAHAFEERVQKQDEICRDLRAILMNHFHQLGDIRVWLILSQLGHSW